ncbi:MAG: hypothetical protein Q8K92_19890 [Leadbetterella sp.]|nr:hypothetical protein [Leadbetterella sp.]
MTYLELKLLLFLIITWEITDINGIDLIIKIIPSAAVTGFTIYKWIKLHNKNKDDDY